MTKEQLIQQLNLHFEDDDIVVCMSEDGGWDNIEFVGRKYGLNAIVWGGGSPFTGE
jgi:hypothetical protein